MPHPGHSGGTTRRAIAWACSRPGSTVPPFQGWNPSRTASTCSSHRGWRVQVGHHAVDLHEQRGVAQPLRLQRVGVSTLPRLEREVGAAGGPRGAAIATTPELVEKRPDVVRRRPSAGCASEPAGPSRAPRAGHRERAWRGAGVYQTGVVVEPTGDDGDPDRRALEPRQHLLVVREDGDVSSIPHVPARRFSAVADGLRSLVDQALARHPRRPAPLLGRRDRPRFPQPGADRLEQVGEGGGEPVQRRPGVTPGAPTRPRLRPPRR
jgi:hypothetical protein